MSASSAVDDAAAEVLSFAAEVRSVLRAQGRTQASLAAELGITEKHLSRMLTGQQAGSPWMWERIARATGSRWVLREAESA